MAGRHKWTDIKRSAKNFDELEQEMGRQRLARAETFMREESQRLLSIQLRKLMGEIVGEGVDVPEGPGPKHPEVDDDVWVGTLKGIVEELGGEVEITIKLPTGRISVVPGNPNHVVGDLMDADVRPQVSEAEKAA